MITAIGVSVVAVIIGVALYYARKDTRDAVRGKAAEKTLDAIKRVNAPIDRNDRERVWNDLQAKRKRRVPNDS